MPSKTTPRYSIPLLITVLSWGFNFVAIKLLYQQMSPPALALVRAAIVFPALALVCFFLQEPLRFPKGKTIQTLVLGFFTMGAYMVLFLEGMKHASASEGAIILATAPIFTQIAAAIAKQERFRLNMIFGALISFAGVSLVVANANSVGQIQNSLGYLLLLGSAIVWAGSTVIMRPLVKENSPLRMVTLSIPGSFLILIPYGGSATFQTPWLELSFTTWWTLFYVVFIAGALGFWGFFTGVRQIGSSRAMLYQYLVPPVAVFSAWLVMGTRLRWTELAGTAIVLAGVTLAQSTPKAEKGI